MEKHRNDGVDLLRIVATLMICIYHVLGVGGVMQNTEYLSAHWAAAWGLEKLMLGCVNCYGLISGYVGMKARFRLSRWVGLWMQVLFYSVGITLMFALVRPDLVSLQDLTLALLPTSTSHYWYFSAYTGMFLMIPLLNHILNTMSVRALGAALLVAVPVFGVFSLFQTDALVLHHGYSPLWLCLLYLVGGWIRLHGESKRPIRFWLGIYLAASAAMLLMKLASDYTFLHYDFRMVQKLYGAYSSPLIILVAIALMQIFIALPCRNGWLKRFIRFAAPACFGVYLFHAHSCVWQHVLLGRFSWIASLGIVPMIVCVVGISTGICVAGMLVDRLRMILFRALRLHKLADWVTAGAQKRLSAVLEESPPKKEASANV